MARRRLSERISEAMELGERLNRLLKTLPPEIRETVIRYAGISGSRRGRRRSQRRSRGRRKQKTEPSKTTG
ncbi:MAG: hypothetical protein QXD32_02315 [Nitrososphaerota archaeon]